MCEVSCYVCLIFLRVCVTCYVQLSDVFGLLCFINFSCSFIVFCGLDCTFQSSLNLDEFNIQSGFTDNGSEKLCINVCMYVYMYVS
jgi:hypothetical protein